MKKNLVILAGVSLIVSALALSGCKEEKQPETVVKTAQPAAVATPAAAVEASGKSGEELYKQHCMVCHPDGRNVIKPEYTLKKAALEARGIKTVEDIVAKMRNPGPGMNKFDSQTVSDADAKKISEYVMATFK